MWCKNVGTNFFRFVTNLHAFYGRTDRGTEFSWLYRALHYMQSYGKNPE